MKDKKDHTIILVNHDGMGNAEPALRHTLIQKYFKLLAEGNRFPTAICFYADGVKLLAEGSPVIPELRRLIEKGIHIVGCTTCLNFYGLLDKLAVGIPVGMNEIISFQEEARKVITL
ncbi:MAG: hypothetical protein Kow0042_30790 [Calditrichia bacterium]